MLAKAIEKIQELANEKERCQVEEKVLFEQGYIHQGDILTRYTTPEVETVEVRSLTALTQMIRSFLENDGKTIQCHLPLIVTAVGNNIKVLSSIDHTYERQLIFTARPIVPDVILDRFIPAEQMIINVNTCFEQNENAEAFIKSISKLYKVSTVESVDNGIGATLKVTEGINTDETVVINPIVALKPIATYDEVNQIERKFNLRVNHEGKVALMVCDKGAFERKVQNQIKSFLNVALDKKVKDGAVILALYEILTMRSRSILDIEGGNIIRQIDNELERVIYNINDESTDLKAREIKISIKITPNKKRNELAVKYNVTSKVSPKDNEPITLVNLKEFDNDTGEFLGSRLSEASGIVPGQINLSGEVAKELPPIVVGSKLQEKNEVVSGISKGLID